MNNRDTLFEDVSGSAVNLFEGIRGGGLTVAVELLEMPPPDGDETFRLLAVEVICAACGQPSNSKECEYIQEWCEENPADVDSTIREKMLSIIDGVVVAGGDEDLAKKMRARIRNLAQQAAASDS